MRVLVLGGTEFVGRHIVARALERGDEVTLFNRGKTNPDLFPEAERLVGDRNVDLSPLSGRRWDAVVDTCAYVPRVARMAAEALADAVGRYCFISTTSVYPDERTTGLDESAPLDERIDDPAGEEVTDTTYGPLKVLCERGVEAVFGDRALHVRPHYVVGPHDPTDRFTYWPYRVARGGRMLAPAPPEYAIQFIDARDLADFTLHLLDEGATGPFNAVGPPGGHPLGTILDVSKAESGTDTEITWADPDWLQARGVRIESDLPLWLPGEAHTGVHAFNPAKATTAGLTYRPLPTTITDTLTWTTTLDPHRPLSAGLTPEREQDLLQAWSTR